MPSTDFQRLCRDMSEFSKLLEIKNIDSDLYFIDLLNHRDVSNEIAVLTGIVHQSPQAIVIKGKEIIYDATHSNIDARSIQSTLRKA